MADVSKIPVSEVLEDYYASRMDVAALATLLIVAPEDAVPSLQERIDGNMHIMQIIKAELTRRGQSE